MISNRLWDKKARKEDVWNKKALYGLKQASRAWNKKFEMSYQIGIWQMHTRIRSICKGFRWACLVMLCLYVYDWLVTWSNEIKLRRFKSSMMNEFEMSYLGNLAYFLGMLFLNKRCGFFLHWKKYGEYILKKLKTNNCNTKITFMKTLI